MKCPKTGKIKHRNRQDAKKHAARLSAKGRGPYRLYLCLDCNSWYITKDHFAEIDKITETRYRILDNEGKVIDDAQGTATNPPRRRESPPESPLVPTAGLLEGAEGLEIVISACPARAVIHEAIAHYNARREGVF